MKRNALHICARKNHLEMAKILIDKQINMNEQDIYKKTPLHEAIKQGNIDFVDLLIKCKVDIELEDGLGNTPLAQAVLDDNLEIAKLLLRNKVNVNGSDIGKSPLFHAIQNKLDGRKNADELIELLIKNGCEFKPEEDEHGNNILHNLVLLKRPDLVEIAIKRGIDKDIRNKYGNTALHLSIKNKLSEITKILVESKANIDIPNDKGVTPLLFAIKDEQIGTVKYLMKQGANYKQDELTYNMPLSIAYKENNMELIKYLIKQGVDINKNILELDEETSLVDISVKREDISLIKLLIDKGQNQAVILSKLIKDDKKQLIEILIKDNSLDIGTFSDNDKQLIFNELNEKPDDSICKLLSNYMDVPDKSKIKKEPFNLYYVDVDDESIDKEFLLNYAATLQDRELIEKLIKQGVNTDSVLYDAVLTNKQETVRMLLDCGASKDALDTIEAKTALYTAIDNKNDAIVKLLLRRRYKLKNDNKKRKIGNTDSRVIEYVRYLSNGGLYQITPMELAKNKKRKTIINLLEEKERENVIDLINMNKIRKSQHTINKTINM